MDPDKNADLSLVGKVVLDLPGGTIIDRLVPYPLLPTGPEFPGWLSDS